MRTRSDYFSEFRALTPEELLAKVAERWSDNPTVHRYGPVEIVYSDADPATVIRVSGVAIAAHWHDGPRIAPEFTAWDAVAWALAALVFVDAVAWALAALVFDGEERQREIERRRQESLVLHRSSVEAASAVALAWFESDRRSRAVEGAD